MIPLKIKLVNFLSYEEEEFDFSKVTCATVVGDNGAGKTSFCTDSITWALFGCGSKGGINSADNYVRSGAESCIVEFSFLLNGTTYKIVRTRNITKGKNSVAFFTVNSEGDEIPLSSGKFSETQSYIEKTLKMNYKTFTSSSMILQNKSNEFTENMTDNERKEALVNILDIDLWDKIGKDTTLDINNLKNQIAAQEALISNSQSLILKEQEYKEKEQECICDIEKIKTKKVKQNKIIDLNQQKIFEYNNLKSEINKLSSDLLNIENINNEYQLQINSINDKIKQDNLDIDSYKKEIDVSEKLIANKDKINQSFDRENELVSSIQQAEKRKMVVLEKQNSLNLIVQQGKDWNNQKEQEILKVNLNISNNKKQAEALNSVPCSSNISFNTSCPFLQMANNAKKELVQLQQKLQQIKQSNNPFREKYIALNNELNELKKTIQLDNLNSMNQELISVQLFSKYKQQLEIAISRVEDFKKMVFSIQKNISTQNELKSSLSEKILNNNKSINLMESDIKSKKEQLKEFDKIRESFSLAKNMIVQLDNQEKEIIGNKSSYLNFLKQIEEAKKNIEVIKNKIIDLQKDITTHTLLKEACSKKSGVPALIIENAVPELENSTNKILEKMLDGRLQVNLETQIESKSSSNMQEVFKINVLDDGCIRSYETYSGAEKFIVALAIRIAMSKFLAHRAGASVQLFVLDEGVSCADENNRNEIMNAILNISDEFAKILFITHINELKDSLPQKIIINKNSSGSHIKLIS